MSLERYNNVRDFAQRVQSEQQELFEQVRAKARGISDEQINSLAKSSSIPIDDIRAMAEWTVSMLKEELKNRGAQIPSDTRKPKLLSMLIHSFILERQQRSRSVRIR